MPIERFKSKNSYRKWNAYRHMHGIPAPHLKAVVVGGKAHKVKHTNKNLDSKKPLKSLLRAE